jgi:hypothetical protein
LDTEIVGTGKLILHSACKAYGARVLIQAQTIMTASNTEKDIIPLSLDYNCCTSEKKTTKLNDIHLDLPLRNIVNCLEDLRLTSHKVEEVDKLVFSSYGRLCSSELVQAVDCFLTTALSGTLILQEMPRGVVAPQGIFWR